MILDSENFPGAIYNLSDVKSALHKNTSESYVIAEIDTKVKSNADKKKQVLY